jgi:hypothetical protein
MALIWAAVDSIQGLLYGLADACEVAPRELDAWSQPEIQTCGPDRSNPKNYFGFAFFIGFFSLFPLPMVSL